MKIFKRIITFALAFVFVISGAILLVGCTPKAEEVTAKFEKVKTTIEGKSTGDRPLFKINEGSLYSVDYYTIDIGITEDEVAEFAEVTSQYDSYYNPIFSYAMSYIAENKVTVTSFVNGKVPDGSKNALKNLNNSLDGMTANLNNFISAKDTLIEDLQKTSSADARATYMRKFQYIYTSFVGSTVDVAVDLAKFVESTDVLKSVASNATGSENLKFLKNYICTRFLPFYKDFYISEFCGFNWNETAQTETKIRINEIRADLSQNFGGLYKDIFTSDVKTIVDATVLKNVLDDLDSKTKACLSELDVVESALAYLSVEQLASEAYKNDLGAYMRDCPNAEACISKIEQFIDVILPSYLEYVQSAICL